MIAQMYALPFNDIEYYSLKYPVISCQEAAFAKGIPLKNELKSLIINTSRGIYVLHIPGNKKANLRAIKKALNVDEAYLASKDILKMLQVEAGTITPLLEQIWDLPQLLSHDVLLCEFVSTNAGIHNKYIIFNPYILMEHKNMIIGYFCN
jgi:prolyl-tRNA editing enzyme YbaK/EbsC (Cys-tRNA(Pro) deacylase)